jgi:hypothetical protein
MQQIAILVQESDPKRAVLWRMMAWTEEVLEQLADTDIYNCSVDFAIDENGCAVGDWKSEKYPEPRSFAEAEEVARQLALDAVAEATGIDKQELAGMNGQQIARLLHQLLLDPEQKPYCLSLYDAYGPDGATWPYGEVGAVGIPMAGAIDLRYGETEGRRAIVFATLWYR